MAGLVEGPHLEFKRTWVDGAKRSAVAFANTDGGTIYIGIEDNGDVTGVSNIDETMRRATQAISDGIRPDVMSFVSVKNESIRNTPVVAVHIQRGAHRPYYLADKGIRPAGVYIRSGAASIPASETAIIDMIKQTAGDSFENAVSLNQELTFTAAQAAFADAALPFTPQAQRTLGMINADGVYTNLAWLLSDQCTASIKAAVFADEVKEVFLNRQEFTGSLLTQFGQVSEFISRHNAVHSYMDATMRRVDNYEYSPLALREAILNLIVHRDYGLSGPALISVFSNHMEFMNLGGLPENFTRADMMNGISSQRNPKLANVFYRLKLVEAYGTGIRRIMGDYKNETIQPAFDISDHAFRLILPKHQRDNAVSPVQTSSAQAITQGVTPTRTANLPIKQQQILDYAKEHGSITRRQAQSVTGVSQSTAIKIINALVGKKLLTRTGNGPHTSYQSVC
ncbi:RNA-binding domain-containing protein [Bifidobacterium felsineum]|uniref:AAA family ATPase n=1 Tax=Bifidobacterium felsineum TaxID=2045440 RepID=A0A2M9HIA7_9BIFI|nr:RNA-binding domain-containing protein [Bifidobacterium felsineum]MBT1164394.1 putative DNA binding domain-containing protein [Bifidobacterium felsineum]PJM76560.1 AAA family ATPase [Bifidobacterium felsineum]